MIRLTIPYFHIFSPAYTSDYSLRGPKLHLSLFPNNHFSSPFLLLACTDALPCFSQVSDRVIDWGGRALAGGVIRSAPAVGMLQATGRLHIANPTTADTISLPTPD